MFPAHLKTKDRRTVSIRYSYSFQQGGRPCRKVDLILLSTVPKSDKLDDIEVHLYNLIVAVSSIEESVRKLERGAFLLASKFENTNSFIKLKESLNF